MKQRAPLHQDTAKQKQQGNPQQNSTEAMECPVEFIRLTALRDTEQSGFRVRR